MMNPLCDSRLRTCFNFSISVSNLRLIVMNYQHLNAEHCHGQHIFFSRLYSFNSLYSKSNSILIVHIILYKKHFPMSGRGFSKGTSMCLLPNPTYVCISSFEYFMPETLYYTYNKISIKPI